MKERFGIETSTSMAKFRILWSDKVLYDDLTDGGPYGVLNKYEEFYGDLIGDLVISIGTTSGYINNSPTHYNLPSGYPDYNFNHGAWGKTRDVELVEDAVDTSEVFRVRLKDMDYTIQTDWEDYRRFTKLRFRRYFETFDIDFTDFFDLRGDIVYIKIWFDKILEGFDPTKKWWDYFKFQNDSYLRPAQYTYPPFDKHPLTKENIGVDGFGNSSPQSERDVSQSVQFQKISGLTDWDYPGSDRGWDMEIGSQYLNVGDLLNIKVDHLGYVPQVWVPKF